MLTLKTKLARVNSQRGLSLVELMVGIALGLFVVAGAATLASTQMVENRRLLLETQVQQDLRAAADIITRDLRRAGFETYSSSLYWSSSSPTDPPIFNGKQGLIPGTSPVVVTYRYDRTGSVGTAMQYQLVSETIRQRIGAGAPQDLTDRSTLKITNFTVAIDPMSVVPEQLACPNLCADLTQNCWPTTRVTEAVITISGEAVSDDKVQRTIVSRVRLRNDGVDFRVLPPGGPPALPAVCP